MRQFPSRALVLTGALALAAPLAHAQAPQLDSATLASFEWRSVGPANMGGRITDVEVHPSNPKIFYFAAAAGGIWKTVNNGHTFFPVFHQERAISMGDMAVAPSNPNIVWAGTGEEDSRNSISPGAGIYKSTDGGLTWQLMGLEKTEAIGRIVIHPTNPDIVYVAALGAIWRSNPERGLYKTTDGGRTWTMSKFISDKAGFVDLVMDPRNPDVLYAAAWERQRGPYFLKSGGPGSGLWKSTDAGRTWTEIRGNGFPETLKGRIGLAIAPTNPDMIYAIVEADAPGNPSASGTPLMGEEAQRRLSGLYRSTDAGRTWERMNNTNNRPFYYSQVRVDPKNPERVYQIATQLQYSDDGGRTLGRTALGVHVDHHALWINPNDPEHMILGNDGGLQVTYDKGGTWEHVNTMALGQFYNISYDMAVPYRICGGLQDNGSWCGPSRSTSGGITNANWFNVGGGDGFVTAQDPTNPDIIYSESQGGAMGRLDLSVGQRRGIRPANWNQVRGFYEDSVIIARGDTTRPETAEQRSRIQELRARAAADSANRALRWNWNTPFFLSPHNPSTFYAGANRVFKSTNRGDDMYPISPDLSTHDTMKIRVSTRTTGGVTPDVTQAETYGTIVSLAESPVRPGILWAGTDDGNLWYTKNDGATWTQVTRNVQRVPRGTYVSRIEPSRYDSSTVYVSYDNHRNGDFTPYVFVSTDMGRTFRSIAGNLPTGGPDFVHVVREDPVNRDLLYVGTDVGAYISLNRGGSWQKFMIGLPTVPVHDLKIHPRDRELIAGTHGRSIWIVDVAPLQEMTQQVLASNAHLFSIKPVLPQTPTVNTAGSAGHKRFVGDNAPNGAQIVYRVARGAPRDSATIVVTDVRGDTMRVLRGPGWAGTHRVTWDLRGPAEPLRPSQVRDSTLAAIRQAQGRARGGAEQQTGPREQGQREAVGPRGAAGRQQVDQPEVPGAQVPRGVNVRPGETPPGEGGGGGGGGRGGFGGGGFGGQRLGGPVSTGQYLVTVTVGGQKMSQVIWVNRGDLDAELGGDEGEEGEPGGR